MPIPSTSLNSLHPYTWELAVEGPVLGVFMTGDDDFYYVWAEEEPTYGEAGSPSGHFVPARCNEVATVPEGISLYVRAASLTPCNLTITLEPVV